MSEPKLQLPSSTESREMSTSDQIFSNFLTSPRVTLKDNLKKCLVINLLDYKINNAIVPLESTRAAPTTILNEEGLIDVNKFTDSVLQSNLMMTKTLSHESNLPYQSYQQLRILENPPILKNGANYRDYDN